MKVTEIVPFGKTRSKVLTDEDFVFVLYRGELRRFGIAEDAVLTEEFLEGTLFPFLTKRAKERVVNLLKDQDRTEQELRRKLRASWYPEPCIDSVISWARDLHYVDDERYARYYLESHSDRRSRRRLIFDLMNRGIPKEVTERLLLEAPADEEAAVEKELRKKRYDPETADDDTKRKLAAYLSRKGYGWEIIGRYLR